MALSFEISGAQIDGSRDYQEDAFLITHLTDKDGKTAALIIVADGMGGHAAGNVASNMAVQAFNKFVTSNYPAEFIHEVLNGAIVKANHSIAETIKETPALEGMGCTMVAALLEGNNLWWASVGDSHLYVIRNRELNKVNADHSYGGFLDAMAAAGTPIEAEPGLSRNMLMSAVTGAEIADVDCPSSPMQIQDGDRILLCSDGIDTLSDGKIIQYCDWSDSPKECAESLLNAVEAAEMPRQDNTTVIAIAVVDKEAAKARAAEEEAEEEEDITDTRGAAKEDLEKTAESEVVNEGPPASEEVVVEGVPEPELAPETPAAVEPAPTPAPAPTPTRAERKPPNKGMIFGIAAAIVIAIAVGAFVMFGGDKKPVGEEEVSVSEITEPEELPEPVAPEEPAIVEQPPQEESVAEPEPEPAVTEAVKEPAPAPQVTPAPKAFTDALKIGGNGPEMVWIPAGSYEMGSPSTSTNADERPQHTVKLKKFGISKYEITFADYDKFARATSRKLPDSLSMNRATTPVFFVSWDDANNYARWLSDQTGKKYRLPSEAEWEYAASGGRSSTFWWGFDEEPGRAHCFTCESQRDPRKPAQIGGFDPNQFGLYDTAGNVAEWVHDCWHDNYDGAPDDGSVWEGGDCSRRIARGGSYISPQQSIRTTKRDKFRSDSGYDHIGFRVVREE